MQHTLGERETITSFWPETVKGRGLLGDLRRDDTILESSRKRKQMDIKFPRG